MFNSIFQTFLTKLYQHFNSFYTPVDFKIKKKNTFRCFSISTVFLPFGKLLKIKQTFCYKIITNDTIIKLKI